MPEMTQRSSWKKRALFVTAGCLVFIILFVLALRVTVEEMFRGIAQSRSTGLSAVGWDIRSMWSSSVDFAKVQNGSDRGSWVARSADLRTHSPAFDRSVESLQRSVTKHRGYFEDLRTESQSGFGRSLLATIAVPSEEFDPTLAELQALGRIESISQAGEDSAVQLATAARRVTAAQTNLARLQKLQRDRTGALRDAVALEKDIAQVGESVADAERQQESLLSTVVQAHIRVILIEDYRAPLQVSMAGAFLQIHNSLVEGTGAIFSTLAFVLSILCGYGLPAAFWMVLLFWPFRAGWRRIRRPRAVEVIA